MQAIGDEAIAPRADGARFAAAAERIGAAVHRVFFRPSTGRYGPTSPATAPARQGHQALALAAGLVPTALIPTVVSSLIDELTNPAGVAKAHIDTGLTATYFMGKIMAGGMEVRPIVLSKTSNNALLNVLLSLTN